MKSKQEIARHLDEALFLLRKQTLNSEELKVRTHIMFAIRELAEADDEDAPKSGAV